MGIKVENLFYTYQKKASNSTLALDNVSLSIEKNDFGKQIRGSERTV